MIYGLDFLKNKRNDRNDNLLIFETLNSGNPWDLEFPKLIFKILMFIFLAAPTEPTGAGMGASPHPLRKGMELPTLSRGDAASRGCSSQSPDRIRIRINSMRASSRPWRAEPGPAGSAISAPANSLAA